MFHNSVISKGVKVNRKNSSQEPTVFLMRKLWSFSPKQHGFIVLYSVMLVIANIILLMHPLIFGAVVSEIQRNGVTKSNLSQLTFLLSLLFGQILAFWVFHGPARVIERMVAFWAELNYRRYLMRGVLSLDLTWHGEHDSGDTIDKVNKASDGLTQFGQNIFQIIQLIVKLLGTVAVLIWFSPAIGVSVFAIVLFSFFIVLQFDKRLLHQYRVLNKLANKASASVFDALSNITTIKILNIENPVAKGVMLRFKDSSKLFRANAELNEWKWFVGNSIFQGIEVVPLIAYLYFSVLTGRSADVGRFSTLYLYLSNLIFVWFGFGSFYEQLTLFKNRILNAEPIEKAFESQRHILRKRVEFSQTVSIRDLNFGYNSEAEELHLDRINLKFNRGERIAVIGESGAGKTTFLKVVHGMYPKAQALIQVDEQKPISTNFADIDLQTMLVPQEPEIFSSTIQENMTLGIKYTEEAVLNAVEISAFDTVLKNLPNGLDSVINEKGVNLSGGQKQLLALARAILFSADKEIILLDESTSSVDSENETIIYQRIFREFKDKTLIASIHKMNLLKFFDRIVIFDKSRIADEGTFEDLLERNLDFQKAWKKFVDTT